MEFSPEFSALVQQYKDTAAGLGDGHPTTYRLWLILEAAAPEGFRQLMRDTAKEMGLQPDPAHCDAKGRPLYDLDAIAAKLGMSSDEARAAMAQMNADRASIGLVNPMLTDGPIHCLH